MPKVNPIYLIGAIRGKEKNFLQDDEYSRIIGAPTALEALEVLYDTPYGIWLKDTPSLSDALEALRLHLKEEMGWLSSYLDEPRVVQFLAARYDALNIASALADYQAGKQTIENISPIQAISKDVLFTTIWKNNSWEDLPAVWRTIVQQERELTQKKDWSKSALFERMNDHLITVMKTLAFTPLMKEFAALTEARVNADRQLRNLTKQNNARSTDEVLKDLERLGYKYFSTTILEQVRSGVSALPYELAWDRQMVEILHKYRSGSLGYDPVISYWFGKEFEVNSIRILLSAKQSGHTPKEIEELKRPLYQHSYV